MGQASAFIICVKLRCVSYGLCIYAGICRSIRLIKTMMWVDRSLQVRASRAGSNKFNVLKLICASPLNSKLLSQKAEGHMLLPIIIFSLYAHYRLVAYAGVFSCLLTNRRSYNVILWKIRKHETTQ